MAGIQRMCCHSSLPDSDHGQKQVTPQGVAEKHVFFDDVHYVFALGIVNEVAGLTFSMFV